MDEEALPRKILTGELYYAKLWLVCVALRGVSWEKMPFEQRELAFQAKDAASACLSNLLNSPTYRAALRYAVHDSLVTAAFSGLFLLKMANLFPAEVDLTAITAQVEQLAQVLSDVAAERYVSQPLAVYGHSHSSVVQVCADAAHHDREPAPQDGDYAAGDGSVDGLRDDGPAVHGPEPSRSVPPPAAADHARGTRHAVAQRPRALQSECDPVVAPGAGASSSRLEQFSVD